MTYYAPGTVYDWAALRLNKFEGVALGMDGPSIGFIPVYASREECQAEHPDKEVVEFEKTEKPQPKPLARGRKRQ